MHTFASIVVGLIMLAVVGVMFAGMITMARGGSGATSNKLMRYRVLLQGGAILVLVIFMSILRG
jgi:Hypoxia induced protein conserved region